MGFMSHDNHMTTVARDLASHVTSFYRWPRDLMIDGVNIVITGSGNDTLAPDS